MENREQGVPGYLRFSQIFVERKRIGSLYYLLQFCGSKPSPHLHVNKYFSTEYITSYTFAPNGFFASGGELKGKPVRIRRYPRSCKL